MFREFTTGKVPWCQKFHWEFSFLKLKSNTLNVGHKELSGPGQYPACVAREASQLSDSWGTNLRVSKGWSNWATQLSFVVDKTAGITQTNLLEVDAHWEKMVIEKFEFASSASNFSSGYFLGGRSGVIQLQWWEHNLNQLVSISHTFETK